MPGRSALDCVLQNDIEGLKATLSDLGARSNVGVTKALIQAVQDNKKEMVEVLVFHGKADVNATEGRKGLSALHYTAGSIPHLQVLETLLKCKADPNARHGADQSTPMHAAASAGNVEAIKLLIKAGARVDARDVSSNTPLYFAAKAGELAAVDALSQHGAEVDHTNKMHVSALDAAAEYGRDAVIELLVQRGANVNGTGREDTTTLIVAAMHGRVSTVESLLRLGADVNFTNKGGGTALHWAALHDQVEVMEILLRHKASVDARDHSQVSALHCAADRGHVRIARLLLRSGANVMLKDEQGFTPLHYAAKHGQTYVAKALLDPLSNSTDLLSSLLTAQDLELKTPLHQAVANGHVDIVVVLLERLPLVALEIYDKLGQTPLLLAARGRQVHSKAILELLLAKGANIAASDKDGQSALHHAAHSGSTPLVELLLAAGARVDARDKRYHETPLHTAAAQGKENIFQLLLQHKADINAQDKDGDTPLHIAIMKDSPSVVQVALSTPNINIMKRNKKGQTPQALAEAFQLEDKKQSKRPELSQIIRVLKKHANGQQSKGALAELAAETRSEVDDLIDLMDSSSSSETRPHKSSKKRKAGVTVGDSSKAQRSKLMNGMGVEHSLDSKAAAAALRGLVPQRPPSASTASACLVAAGALLEMGGEHHQPAQPTATTTARIVQPAVHVKAEPDQLHAKSRSLISKHARPASTNVEASSRLAPAVPSSGTAAASSSHPTVTTAAAAVHCGTAAAASSHPTVTTAAAAVHRGTAATSSSHPTVTTGATAVHRGIAAPPQLHTQAPLNHIHTASTPGTSSLAAAPGQGAAPAGTEKATGLAVQSRATDGQQPGLNSEPVGVAGVVGGRAAVLQSTMPAPLTAAHPLKNVMQRLINQRSAGPATALVKPHKAFRSGTVVKVEADDGASGVQPVAIRTAAPAAAQPASQHPPMAHQHKHATTTITTTTTTTLPSAPLPTTTSAAAQAQATSSVAPPQRPPPLPGRTAGNGGQAAPLTTVHVQPAARAPVDERGHGLPAQPVASSANQAGTGVSPAVRDGCAVSPSPQQQLFTASQPAPATDVPTTNPAATSSISAAPGHATPQDGTGGGGADAAPPQSTTAPKHATLQQSTDRVATSGPLDPSTMSSLPVCGRSSGAAVPVGSHRHDMNLSDRIKSTLSGLNKWLDNSRAAEQRGTGQAAATDHATGHQDQPHGPGPHTSNEGSTRNEEAAAGGPAAHVAPAGPAPESTEAHPAAPEDDAMQVDERSQEVVGRAVEGPRGDDGGGGHENDSAEGGGEQEGQQVADMVVPQPSTSISGGPSKTGAPESTTEGGGALVHLKATDVSRIQHSTLPKSRVVAVTELGGEDGYNAFEMIIQGFDSSDEHVLQKVVLRHFIRWLGALPNPHCLFKYKFENGKLHVVLRVPPGSVADQVEVMFTAQDQLEKLLQGGQDR